jgi:pyruvate formate lyase activating enzyme
MCLQDGPGVRTGVFFKGCPLRCRWCHNPESYTMGAQLRYNARLCTGCGLCAAQCPGGLHTFDSAHRVRHADCAACGRCVRACCYGALSLAGAPYTVDALLDAIAPDRAYYGDTGGVTLSGGEPMAQFDFVMAFLRRKGGLHVCVETSGFAPTRHYLEMLPYVDLFLFDYKATDPQKHRELCGQDNRLILSNLQALYDSGASILLRLPLVPGVNDDADHLRAVAGLLAAHPRLLGAEIMAYHRLGVGKRQQFGLAGDMDLPNATPAQKQGWLDALHALGAANVRLG